MTGHEWDVTATMFVITWGVVGYYYADLKSRIKRLERKRAD